MTVATHPSPNHPHKECAFSLSFSLVCGYCIGGFPLLLGLSLFLLRRHFNMRCDQGLSSDRS